MNHEIRMRLVRQMIAQWLYHYESDSVAMSNKYRAAQFILKITNFQGPIRS